MVEVVARHRGVYVATSVALERPNVMSTLHTDNSALLLGNHGDPLLALFGAVQSVDNPYPP